MCRPVQKTSHKKQANQITSAAKYQSVTVSATPTSRLATPKIQFHLTVVMNMAGYVPKMTGCVLNMIGLVVNMTGFVLEMTGYFIHMTGFVLHMAGFFFL